MNTNSIINELLRWLEVHKYGIQPKYSGYRMVVSASDLREKIEELRSEETVYEDF